KQALGYQGRIVRDDTGGSGDKRHFWQCLEERVEVSGTINPNPIKQYIYFPFYIDAVASVLYDEDTDGLHDANFNVVAMVTGTTSFNVSATDYGNGSTVPSYLPVAQHTYPERDDRRQGMIARDDRAGWPRAIARPGLP